MHVRLERHPGFETDAVTAVDAEVRRLGPRRLVVHYIVTGSFRHIVLPPWHSGRRTDGLWRHTCFEAFVRAGRSGAYYEFNFSPSSDWACYRFSDYREGMEAPPRIGDPRAGGMIQRRLPDDFQRNQRKSEGFTTVDRYAPPFFWLGATLELKQAVDLPVDLPWRIGLSAVIEERNGRLSYWALNHPPGAPDFHHPDCFALELPAAKPA